ncbi:MBL fold metallo-hydrolase [Roseicitreum antarcticum]|uniref:Glyoxylase, beta-lactamase superfamily II n=1 Tax=Roseicitreum antarcticum TaxID=564137 RepID=A0A1H2S8Z8_9RHOB|nr:MBL fold metallo-hydrolase [Roseicitreum antarcticum]SDW27990.1 Glyoxylase, beta-lactamase superfamily II [Roseicitreum antarcticum]
MRDGADQGIRTPFPDPPAPGTATQVAPGVLWARMPLPMALDHVNIYALDDGPGWTLVDTGFDTAPTRAAWKALLAGPLAGKPVTRVIGTHHHPDHIGLAGWFQTDHGADLWMTRTAWLMARMLQLDEQAAPTPQALAFWRAFGMDEAIFAQRAAERPFNFCDVVAPMPQGFHRMHDGDSLRAGGRDWDVVIGHGHAPAHAVLISRDCNLILGGDQLLPSISANLGVYPTEPGADPVADWLDSCTRFQALARPDHLVLPGHKLPFTGLPLRLVQMIDNHRHALDRLRDHLHLPRRGGECFAPLFRRGIGPETYGLAMAETVAHLNHLHRRGQVTRSMGTDGAWRWQS